VPKTASAKGADHRIRTGTIRNCGGRRFKAEDASEKHSKKKRGEVKDREKAESRRLLAPRVLKRNTGFYGQRVDRDRKNLSTLVTKKQSKKKEA